MRTLRPHESCRLWNFLVSPSHVFGSERSVATGILRIAPCPPVKSEGVPLSLRIFAPLHGGPSAPRRVRSFPRPQPSSWLPDLPASPTEEFRPHGRDREEVEGVRSVRKRVWVGRPPTPQHTGKTGSTFLRAWIRERPARGSRGRVRCIGGRGGRGCRWCGRRWITARIRSSRTIRSSPPGEDPRSLLVEVGGALLPVFVRNIYPETVPWRRRDRRGGVPRIAPDRRELQRGGGIPPARRWWRPPSCSSWGAP